MAKGEKFVGTSLSDLRSLGLPKTNGSDNNTDRSDQNKNDQKSESSKTQDEITRQIYQTDEHTGKLEDEASNVDEVDDENDENDENEVDDQTEYGQEVEVPVSSDQDAEKYEQDIEEASEILSEGDDTPEEEYTPESLREHAQQFRQSVEIPEPTEEQKGYPKDNPVEAEVERQTDDYISQMAEESERRALQRVRNRKQVRDLVKSYFDIQQSVVHMLARVGVKIPYRRISTQTGVKVENLHFEEGKEYHLDTLIMGIIHSVSEFSRVYSQNQSLEKTLENYQQRINSLSDLTEQQDQQIKQFKSELNEIRPYAQEQKDHPVSKLDADHPGQFLLYDTENMRFVCLSEDADDETEYTELGTKDFETTERIGPALKFDTSDEANEVLSMLRQSDKEWRKLKKRAKKNNKTIRRKERKQKEYKGPDNIKNFVVHRVVLQKH